MLQLIRVVDGNRKELSMIHMYTHTHNQTWTYIILTKSYQIKHSIVMFLFKMYKTKTRSISASDEANLHLIKKEREKSTFQGDQQMAEHLWSLK